MISRLSIPGLLIVGLLAGGPTSVAARDDHVSGELFLRVDGSRVRLVMELRIEEGWHLYHTEPGGDLDESGEGYPARPLVITASEDAVSWSPPLLPPPVRYEDRMLENWVNVHTGTIRIYLAGQLADGSEASDVRGALSGATCSVKGACLRYDEVLEPAGAGQAELFADFPTALVPGSD